MLSIIKGDLYKSYAMFVEFRWLWYYANNIDICGYDVENIYSTMWLYIFRGIKEILEWWC